MADKIGGYQLPSTTTSVSDSWNGHRNRPTPSTEPGTDYPCAYGSTIFAPEDGKVVDLKTSTSGGTGRYVTIDFNDGYRGRALHLSAILVSVGQTVKRGQAIARSGASGWGKEWGYGAHVHQTLWSFHGYSFGKNATIDFANYVGADNDGQAGPAYGYDQNVANEQSWMNQSRGEKLVVDGLLGGANSFTRAAIKRYQTFLKASYGYTGAIDGDWGAGTQAAHAKYYNAWMASLPKPNPSYHTATVADLRSLPYTNGLQKIAKLYGYTGKIDNDFGPGSQAAFQKFLNQNYGGSLATWLRSKWGYKDGDNLWGPNMAAAASRAENANWKQL